MHGEGWEGGDGDGSDPRGPRERALLSRALRTSGLSLTDPMVLVDGQGLQNLVIHDVRRGVVWRFPRREAAAVALPGHVDRHRSALSAGLPVPQVLHAEFDGGPGRAHLVIRRVVGTALDEAPGRAGSLHAAAPRVRDRTAAHLVEALEVLAHQARPAWSAAQPGWVQLWQQWRTDCRTLVNGLAATDRLTLAEAEEALASAAAAERLASTAQLGLVHGDMGGVNVRIDAETGDLVALLDWDGAFFGDVRTDVAALHAGAPRSVWLAMVARRPELADAAREYDTYLATWRWQALRWAEAKALGQGGAAIG